MKRIILAFLHVLIFSSLSGKDSGYFIRNYSPKEYNGFNQVWSSLQDSSGVMYFGTSTNIFAFDGKSWTPIPIVSGNPIRSMCLGPDGIIYVGSYSSFGFLEKQPNGILHYKELSNQLPEAQKKFTDVWKVFSMNGEMIFQTSEGIYFFKDHKYLTSILPSKTFALSFYCKGHLYIRQRQVGIQEIVNHKLQTLIGGDAFADQRCLDIIPSSSGTFLLLTGDSGFYSFNPNGKGGFKKNVFPCQQYLKDCFVLGAKYIDDSTIAILSRVGIGFIDTKGHLKETLSTDDGLIDNSISSVMRDREGQLWLTTGNGISHLFYHSNARYFRNQKSGFEGDVNTLIDYQQHIYIGTTAGLYRSTELANAKNNYFELLGFQQTEIWSFLVAGNDLLIGTSNGLCIYGNGKPNEYLSNSFTRDIVFNKDSSRIFCSEMGGVRMLENRSGKWETVSVAATQGEQQSLLISQFNFPTGNRIWCIGQSGILYRIDFSDKGNVVRSYGTESGIATSVTMIFVLGDSVCAKTGKEIFVYQPNLDKGEGSKCFISSKHIDEVISEQGSGLQLNCNEKGKLIRTTNVFTDFIIRHYAFFKRNKKTGLYDPVFINLSECASGDFIYSYVDSFGDFWLSYSGMIVHTSGVDLSEKPVSFNTMITHVTVNKDSLLFAGFNEENTLVPKLEYKENNLLFRFASPSFNHEELTSYSYMLEGFDKDWSQYSLSSEKEYTNLPEGDYVFVVRSINVLGQEGKLGRYHFTVLPPWYRTIWAYCIYFVFFVFAMLLSIRLGARRLRKQKEKLEVIVAERTAEVVEQKHKIEKQNHQLESAYKGIQDSIHYAERIQHAILPVATEIHNSFPDSFVFFRPRDIVSGDFYWFVKRGELTWIACVDCTGHGVPGAFMSMIGNTLLNEIVLEKNILSPDKILNLLHIRIRQALRQDVGGETRDGMDISLCLIDHEKKKLSYAGANRALWIIRNKTLITYPPNKFSIGGDQGQEERLFNLQQTELISGDCIYLSSDGYADQFGGPRGKKFMVKKFQELVLEIHALPMNEQNERIEKTFTNWKGDLEQVDDVLVIGFRYHN